jgi:hypothetical protein
MQCLLLFGFQPFTVLLGGRLAEVTIGGRKGEEVQRRPPLLLE